MNKTEKAMDTDNRRYYRTITVWKKPTDMQPVWSMHWTDLPWEVAKKWHWYYRYRAALAQVMYPKYTVRYMMGSGKTETEEEEKERKWKNAIAGKKGQITKILNAMVKAREEWNELFPIEDYEPFKKAMEKLQNKENILRMLEEMGPQGWELNKDEF